MPGLRDYQMFKLVLEKAEEPEIKLPTFAGSSKKQESSRKTSTSASLTTLKPLTVFSSVSEKAMATHSSTLAWKITWMEEPGRLQSTGSLRVRHD